MQIGQVLLFLTSFAGLKQASLNAWSSVPGKKSGCTAPYKSWKDNINCIQPILSFSKFGGTVNICYQLKTE